MLALALQDAALGLRADVGVPVAYTPGGVTLHYTTLHYTTLHYTTLTTLHYTTPH